MSFTQLKEKLRRLDEEFSQTYRMVQSLFKTKQHHYTDSPLVFCYFNQSIILDYEENKSPLIIGSFYVQNLSPISKESPIILLKVTANNDFNFSGKFKSPRDISKSHNFLWERLMMKHLDPKTHFCFRPTSDDQLKPYDQLAFENFQIKVPLKSTIQVEGFVYFDHKNEGIYALNSINLSC